MTTETGWNWVDGLSAVWRGRYWVLLVTALAGLLTAGAMLMTPRTYEAVATVRVGRVMDKLIEEPQHAAAMVNGNTVAARLGPAFSDLTTDQLVASVSANAAPGTNAAPLITVTGRAHTREQAKALSTAVAQMLVGDHADRYQRLIERQHRYRDELRMQIDAIRTEVADIEATVKSTRANPGVSAPAVLLMRAQLEEKQSQLLGFNRELRDLESGLAAQSQETRMVGEPIVPRSRMRPQRTLVTLAGAATGALLSIFWVVASDGRRHRPAPLAPIV